MSDSTFKSFNKLSHFGGIFCVACSHPRSILFVAHLHHRVHSFVVLSEFCSHICVAFGSHCYCNRLQYVVLPSFGKMGE